MSEAEENDDNRTAWLQASYTKRMLKAFKAQLEKEEKALFQISQTSTDPNITGQAGRVSILRMTVLTLEKDDK